MTQESEVRKGVVQVDLSTGINQAESEVSIDPSKALIYSQNTWIRNDGEVEMRPGARRVFTSITSQLSPLCMVDDRNFIACNSGSSSSNIVTYTADPASTYSETDPYYLKAAPPSVLISSVASAGDSIQLGGDNFSQRPCGSAASDDYVCLVHFRTNAGLTGVGGTYYTDIFERSSGQLVYSDQLSAPGTTDCTIHVGVIRSGSSQNVFVQAYVSTVAGTHTYSIRTLVKDKAASTTKFTASTPVAQGNRLLAGLICLDATAYVVSASSGAAAFVDKYPVSSDGTIGTATNTSFPANFQPDAANYTYVTHDTISTAQFIITGVNTSTNKARHALYLTASDTFSSDTTTTVNATYGTNRVIGINWLSSSVSYFVTGTSSQAYPTVAGSVTTGTLYSSVSGSTLYGWLPSALPFLSPTGVLIPCYGYATGGVQTEHVLIRFGSDSTSQPYSSRETYFQLAGIVDQELSGAPIATTSYFANHCVPLDTKQPKVTTSQQCYSSNFYCLRRKNSANSCSYHAIELKHTFEPVRTIAGPNGMKVSAGAFPLFDDGKRIGELGVIGVPTIGAVLKTAGTTLTGSYVYYAVYVATDELGNVAYSRVTTLPAITASGDDFELIVLAPTVTTRFGAGAGTNYNIRCDVYRTGAGGTIPYLLCTTDPAFSTRVMTSAGNGWYTYTDSTSDSTLSSSQQLFRQPGVSGSAVDRYVPPGSGACCVHRDRIWWGDPYGDVWYSAPFIFGEQPWTNPFFKVTIPFGTGPVTMIQSFGGRLYVGKRDVVVVIDGDGPPENGGNGTEFTIPTVIVDGFGPIHLRGSCVAPTGIFFRTSRGIEALTQSGPTWAGRRIRRTLDTLKYVGSANAIPEETIDMVYHPYSGHVYCLVQNYLYHSTQDTPGSGSWRNYLVNNAVLVYDVSRDVWSTWAFNTEWSAGGATSPATYPYKGKSTFIGGMAIDTSADSPSVLFASGIQFISRISLKGTTAQSGVTTGFYGTDDVASYRSPVQMILDTGHMKVTGPIGKVRIYDVLALVSVTQSSGQYVSFGTYTNYSSTIDASVTRITGGSGTDPQYFNWNPSKANVNAQRATVLVTSITASNGTTPSFPASPDSAPVIHSLAFQVGEKPGIPLVGTTQKGTS